MKGGDESLIILLVLFLLGRKCEKEIKISYGFAGVIFAILIFVLIEIIGRIFDVIN